MLANFVDISRTTRNRIEMKWQMSMLVLAVAMDFFVDFFFFFLCIYIHHHNCLQHLQCCYSPSSHAISNHSYPKIERNICVLGSMHDMKFVSSHYALLTYFNTENLFDIRASRETRKMASSKYINQHKMNLLSFWFSLLRVQSTNEVYSWNTTEPMYDINNRVTLVLWHSWRGQNDVDLLVDKHDVTNLKNKWIKFQTIEEILKQRKRIWKIYDVYIKIERTRATAFWHMLISLVVNIDIHVRMYVHGMCKEVRIYGVSVQL